MPTQQEHRCVDKLLGLHEEWVGLNRHKTRKSNVETEKRNNFVINKKQLFDISHGDVLQQVDDLRKEFLMNQRCDGRVGFINDIEGYFEEIERKENQRSEIENQRRLKNRMEVDMIGKYLR